MVLRRVATIALATTFACASRPRTYDRAPPNLAPEEVAECAARVSSTPGQAYELDLIGVDPAVRAAIGDRVKQERVAVLALSESRCNVHVDILACTRRLGHRVESFDYSPWDGSLGFPRVALHTRTGARFAGIGSIVAAAGYPSEAVFIKLRTANTRVRTASWWQDMGGPQSFGRFDWAGLPLAVSELVGSDCSRATHYVTKSESGEFRVSTQRFSAIEAPPEILDESSCHGPSCDEVTRITVVPIARRSCAGALTPTPRGCANLTPPLPLGVDHHLGSSCAPPVAGQMTEQHAQAKRLLEAGRYSEAAAGYVRVADGSTGDDPGNRELGAFYFAVATAAAGDGGTGMAVMTAIAMVPCHLKQREAALWVAVMAHRTTHPPMR